MPLARHRGPGRSRLVTVAAVAALVALSLPARAEDAAKPAHKDTSARLQPKEVVFTTAVAPAAAVGKSGRTSESAGYAAADRTGSAGAVR